MTPLRIVVFEGIDRSGKSTLRKRVGQLTHERYVTLARFILSNAAYDIIFGRTTGPGVAAYMRAIERMERDYEMLTIFVDTPPSICYERDPEGYTVEELEGHRRVFLSLLGDCKYAGNRMVLRTVRGGVVRTVDDLAGEVCRWLELS